MPNSRCANVRRIRARRVLVFAVRVQKDDFRKVSAPWISIGGRKEQMMESAGGIIRLHGAHGSLSTATLPALTAAWPPAELLRGHAKVPARASIPRRGRQHDAMAQPGGYADVAGWLRWGCPGVRRAGELPRLAAPGRGVRALIDLFRNRGYEAPELNIEGRPSASRVRGEALDLVSRRSEGTVLPPDAVRGPEMSTRGSIRLDQKAAGRRQWT